MKFGILTLVFYGIDTLEKMLANTGSMVERIYLSHSPVPWNAYNDKARNVYKSSFEKERIAKLPYSHKIIFLEGVWSTEEEQRNHALEAAKNDGIDYLIIQDADEFYMPEDFEANLLGIQDNPNYPAYRCPWTVFWKNINYVIQVRKHEGKRHVTVTTCPNFAINLNWPDNQFSERRLVKNMDQAFMLPGLCLHLAWVLSDEDVKKKIKTWGHSHQFNAELWYKHKWLAWTPNTKSIGHITRYNYRAAVPFVGSLPREIRDLQTGKQTYIELNLIEKIYSMILDAASFLRVTLSKLKSYLKVL